MSKEFHQILSELRRNKKISQRKVAADLYISQALLSHYENGIREPGLDFVNRACHYYGVSADFLLGRTAADIAENLSASHEDAHFDARALMTLLQSVNQLEEALLQSALRCFGAVSYRLLRHMSEPLPTAPALSTPENRVAGLVDMELCCAEMQFLNGLEQLARDRGPDESRRLLSQQLETLLYSLDQQISRHTQSEGSL
ncbi:MAG: helix-turn-helix domain-containing protein [Oscillospiraceae bacterium]|nr:helix-turn-helix domain-containing protein [Oscillospiraceae bacterium]